MKIKKIDRSDSISRRGKPSLDSYTESGDLTDRLKEFTRLWASGYLPWEAGTQLDKPAKKEQVDRWIENVAIRKYYFELLKQMPEKRELEKIEQIRQLQHEFNLEVLCSLVRKAKKDEIGVKDLFTFKERGEINMGMVKEIDSNQSGAQQAITYKEVSIKGMMEKTPKEVMKRIQDMKDSSFTKKKDVVDV